MHRVIRTQSNNHHIKILIMRLLPVSRFFAELQAGNIACILHQAITGNPTIGNRVTAAQLICKQRGPACIRTVAKAEACGVGITHYDNICRIIRRLFLGAQQCQHGFIFISQQRFLCHSQAIIDIVGRFNIAAVQIGEDFFKGSGNAIVTRGIPLCGSGNQGIQSSRNACLNQISFGLFVQNIIRVLTRGYHSLVVRCDVSRIARKEFFLCIAIGVCFGIIGQFLIRLKYHRKIVQIRGAGKINRRVDIIVEASAFDQTKIPLLSRNHGFRCIGIAMVAVDQSELRITIFGVGNFKADPFIGGGIAGRRYLADVDLFRRRILHTEIGVGFIGLRHIHDIFFYLKAARLHALRFQTPTDTRNGEHGEMVFISI